MVQKDRSWHLRAGGTECQWLCHHHCALAEQPSQSCQGLQLQNQGSEAAPVQVVQRKATSRTSATALPL